MRPHVVAHVAISADGATTGFAPDQATFYELVATWSEDVTLTGADTILAQEPALAGAAGPGPSPEGPLLAVVDGRSRVRAWEQLRDAGHWCGVVALRAQRSPDAGGPPDAIVAGDDRVDLTVALDRLGERGARVVRVDSGGALIGALLDRGLVDEISLLAHPTTVPDSDHRWAGQSRGRPLTLTSCESVGRGLVWLRYGITRGDGPP